MRDDLEIPPSDHSTVGSVPYYARVIRRMTRGRDARPMLLVGVFRRGVDGDTDQMVGSYERSYDRLMRTFYPFRVVDMVGGERWFALFAPSYNNTRIMSLPDCTDIGGEDPMLGEFCPVEYYVPQVLRYEFGDGVGAGMDGSGAGIYPPGSAFSTLNAALGGRIVFLPQTVGFIAGSVLGNDTLVTIQHLDLSTAASGKFIRDARYGDIELPRYLSLGHAVDMSDYDWPREVSFAIVRYFDTATGQEKTP